MKNLSIFLMLVCSFATQAMEGRKGQALPIEGSKLRPIVVDDDEEGTRPVDGQSSQKRAKKAEESLSTEKSSPKKEVRWSPEPPKHEKRPRAFFSIEDKKFKLEPMRSSADYIKNFGIIYDDAEKKGIKAIAGVSRDLAFKFITRIQAAREYDLDLILGVIVSVVPQLKLQLGEFFFQI